MRVVLHIDMDAFFASVEERDKPRLRGRPIVVGSDPKNGKGRGVVSTANYPARKYGIKSALPISKAWDLSQQAKKAGKPEVVFMGVDMRRYGEISHQIMDYIAKQGDAFEAAGIDEAYLELRIQDLESREEWEKAEQKATEIKDYIKKEFGLTCSIGVGPNKLMAKIAVEENKPDGLTLVRIDEVLEFLENKNVRVVPGIGPKAEQQLLRMGVRTVGDLRQKSQDELKQHFGKRGIDLWEKARGIDDEPVAISGAVKSIGRETTFMEDTLDPNVILPYFKEIAKEVYDNLAKEQMTFRTVTVVIRFSGFETHTKSHTIEAPAQDLQVIETEAMKLLLPFLDGRENPGRKKLRLVGIRLGKLEEVGGQGNLF